MIWYLENNLKCLAHLVHSQRYPAEVTDLISEGEIGSGTCGQVFKVRFKKTGHVIAVKVRTLLVLAEEAFYKH